MVVENAAFNLGGGYVGIYAYNTVTDKFDLVNSAFYDENAKKMTVDLEVGGVDGILRSVMATGVDASTDEAIFQGAYTPIHDVRRP